MAKEFKKPKNHPKFGLAIDWETSGADWDNPVGSHIKYQGLSFGAVVFDADTFEEIERLYCEIKFDESKYSWTEEAAKIHGLTREYLEANGIDREEAAVLLAELILKYFGPNERIMFLGHNVDFDIGFTDQLLNDFGIEIKKHHVKLDTSSTGFITTNRYKSDQLFEYLGFDKRNAHNAMDDILMTIETCRIIRAFCDYAGEEFLNG